MPIQRLLPQDRSATGSEVVDIQRTTRRSLIQPRGSRAEHRSRAIGQCRTIAIRLIEQRIGGGILEIRHAPTNGGREIREGTQVVIHQHGPRHADAPGEGLQQDDFLAFRHGASLDLAILHQRHERWEITHPQMPMRLEVAEIAAEEDLPIARRCRLIRRQQHFVRRSREQQRKVGGGVKGALGEQCRVARHIGDVWLGDTLATDAKFAGLVRIDRHLSAADQAANANLIAETGGKWTANHRGRGRAYVAVRLKITAQAFPSGPPNISALVQGANTILDPRSNTTGWSDNPALCLAWYLTAPFGWKASWDDIDIPALIAAANICDELIGTRAGVYEKRYTVNGRVSLGEGKIAITCKLVAAMAGALVVSGGRFFIHAGGPALPVTTLNANALRGDVTIQGSRPRRDLFNGVRAVYVDPAKNWQPTDAPPLLAAN